MRKTIVAVGAVITAILLAVASFVVVGLHGRYRQQETAIRLIELSRVVRDHRKAEHHYPKTGPIELERVEPLAAAAHAQDLSTRDSWGHPLVFESDGRHFVLWSPGRNGEIDRYTGGGRRKGVDVDLIVYDGKFWQLPHGI